MFLKIRRLFAVFDCSYQNTMRLLRDLLAEADEGVLSYGRPNGLISAASLVDLFSERLGLFLTL